MGALRDSLRESRNLSDDANQWSIPGAPGRHPHISAQRRDSLVELAFLKSFLAWEAFLEESFLLYLVGQGPPRGRGPRRFAFPPTFRAAKEWVVPEHRRFADWTDPQQVSERAKRFFRDGRPFSPILHSNQNALHEAHTIRNAVAHVSLGAREKFESLVRNRLGTLPPHMSIGGFLRMPVPGATSPASFLESYLSRIEFIAQQIIPGA